MLSNDAGASLTHAYISDTVNISYSPAMGLVPHRKWVAVQFLFFYVYGYIIYLGAPNLLAPPEDRKLVH
jgi:hypothetical protein